MIPKKPACLPVVLEECGNGAEGRATSPSVFIVQVCWRVSSDDNEKLYHSNSLNLKNKLNEDLAYFILNMTAWLRYWLAAWLFWGITFNFLYIYLLQELLSQPQHSTNWL